MILIDSSGWLQYFLGDALADTYGAFIEGEEPILVPAVVLYEVYKTLRRQVDEDTADQAALHLTTRKQVPLDAELALAAAEISLRHSLPFADAVIYATAETHEATIVTSDQHFDGLARVQYIPKP
ncbi:MAG: type II toxin-antitoxin system VapC family toxin [Armatimonadota bacterium]